MSLVQVKVEQARMELTSLKEKLHNIMETESDHMSLR